MKKVVLSLAVLFSVALVSCGGQKAAEADTTPDTIVTEDVMLQEDSISPDSAALEVVAESDTLVANK